MEEEGAEELSKSEQEWNDYFRALFPKVSEQPHKHRRYKRAHPPSILHHPLNHINPSCNPLKVTLEKIATFQQEYQGSMEEREDVLRAYVDCQGKMARVIDSVMLATDGGLQCALPLVGALGVWGEAGKSHPAHLNVCQPQPQADDEPRLRALIEAAIKAKEVPRFKVFKAEAKADSKRQAKASKVRTRVNDGWEDGHLHIGLGGS